MHGSVQFRAAPAEQGTEVTLRLTLDEGAAGPGEVLPRWVAGTTLRRFKSLVETGEIPTLNRNPSARASAAS
jgi:hypothetical protein